MEIRSDQRMDRAEQRMEKFDLRLEATRKLAEAGIRIVVDIGRRQKALEATARELTTSQTITEQSVRELVRSQKAFLDSLTKGGHGRLH
jgi:hypothetical protein